MSPQLLLLNFPGLLDETLILGAFIYWVGPKDVAYSLKHGYQTWVAPRIEPYIEQYMQAVGATSKKKEE